MKQIWHDLLFAHWPMPAAAMRALVPDQLELDIFDGNCWLGVVPFRMSGIRARGLPPVPGFSAFPELNVRTYVKYRGKAGVYFFSLDAANRAAVWTARHSYHLPYFYAAMSCVEEADGIRYASSRRRSPAEFRGSYRPTSQPYKSKPGSLEHWLTERYCLYAVHANRVYRGDIHHQPWPLQNAEAEIGTNTMASASGISLPDTGPVLHFARRLEVLIWPLCRAD